MENILKNKKLLVMGVRNRWSIAWGIVQEACRQGAEIVLTFQGEREREGVAELAAEIGSAVPLACDIASDEEIDRLFAGLKNRYGVLHGVVHAIAHAKREDLQSLFLNTSREGFAHAMNISAYSLVAVSRAAKDLMTEGGSIVTLTYMGAERVFPGYNVMGVAKAALEASVRYLASDLGPFGVRVNAISAGAIKTVSSKAIKDFGEILDVVEQKAPMRRRVTQEDIGRTALYLLSDLSGGVTGEVIHTDCGYGIMGI